MRGGGDMGGVGWVVHLKGKQGYGRRSSASRLRGWLQLSSFLRGLGEAIL